MKFSKKLQQRAHPKYREHYIAYKEMKKAIRLITGKDTSTFTIKEVTNNFGSSRALSGAEYQSAESRFQNILNGELEKINNFTKKMIKEWYDDMKICLEILQKRSSLLDMPQIMKKLNGLADTLKFLQTYRIINFTGFTKITKKFDKHNDKVVSSSFYITVVMKSFFMNYDMNLLLCILSLCYKHYREVSKATSSNVSTGDNLEGESTDHRVVSTTHSLLPPRPPEGSSHGERHSGEKHSGEVHSREDHPSEVHHQMTRTSTLDRKKRNEKSSSPSGESHQSADSASPKESVPPQIDGEKPRIPIKHTKYIVKAQDLINAKVEISKYYTFHYYDLKEHELIPPFEIFLGLISTSKVQNELTTIYFDDSTFSSYHKCVNRSDHHGGSNHRGCTQSVRLRCYRYTDAEKESTKTVIQHFNLFEPSFDPNEKYVFAKDVPQEDLKIECVNDLYNLRKKGGSSSPSHALGSSVHGSQSLQGLGVQDADSLPMHHYERCIRDLQNNNLMSCLKSKLNRIHFGDDNVSGYIDENISYWVHTDKGAIHGCEEVDSDEGEHSELDEPGKVRQHNDVRSEGNHHGAEYKTYGEEESEIESTMKEKKRKYAYFDYAVIDINVKESSSNRDFSFQLSHLGGVVKEIWGYSSYLQGISMLYPHRISTAPHWRIYTDTQGVKGNASDGKQKGKKEKKGGLGVDVEVPVGVDIDVGRRQGEAKQRKAQQKQNRKPSNGGKSGTLRGKGSNKSILFEEDHDTDLSSSENTIEYTERVEKHPNGKKDERKGRKKGITYTGASARIAHESEVIFRNEIERNKSTSSRHINLNIDSTCSGDYCTKPGNYIHGPYNRDSSNTPRKKSHQKEKQCTVTHTLAEDNNLYEPLLDPVEEIPSKGNKSSSCWIISFFKKIFFCKNNVVEIKRPKTAVVRVEPKTFFANERTLLQWLNTSVLLSTISITLLNFSNSYGFASGVIMAPVAIFFILYSFHIYLKRAEALINKEPINYTDKVGPGVLVITLTFALSTVVLLNIYSRLKGEV
ncbi:hypothetical protein C922_03488 [Plasmodium inui San Antonio 1]|uniref:SPX domain-containing protein n=1 Tax=Plasmodium inui San Antonio 1 TaxID=1237626 RepID=W7A3Z9_9APIC|nr:hypothetical protein C922_03488 [Plasmodium inui San Antonio 1]EUD66018.1 hypothetical protein C922_03488 [Plasmodium inui San Antonio 1]